MGTPPPGRGSRWLRRADFWLGVPLVWLGGLLRRRRERPAAPQRIALLKTAAIGDLVLMSGPLRDLRLAWPHARITLLCGPGNAGMGALLAGADEVVQLPIGNLRGALRALGPRRFDLVIDFGAWPRLDALYTLLARGAFRVGFATAGQYRHYLYHAAVPHAPDVHELDNYRALLAAVGVASSTPPRLAAAALPADVLAALYGRPFVVFHLWPGGSNAAAREWPLQRWLALARALIDRGYGVVLTGSGHDRPANEQLVRRLDAGRAHVMVNAAGRSLAQTLALLARGACTVSVNTGVMHMAAALGVPVIGLHGATAVRRWGPVGPRAVALASTVPGCGCLDLGFEAVPRDDCTHSISVDQVLAAVEKALQAPPAAAPGAPYKETLPPDEHVMAAPRTAGSARAQAGCE